VADALAQGAGIVKPDAIRVLKELDGLGLGRYLVGRRGGTTRFEWNRHPASVARAARGEVDDLPPSIYDEEADAFENLGPDHKDTIVDEYKLRLDFQVRTLLPSDLTKEEAGRLADHIRTLYFA